MIDASKDMLERYEKGLAQEEELFLQLEQWFHEVFSKDGDNAEFKELENSFYLNPIEFYHEWRD
jgi:hypothetical protein